MKSPRYLLSLAVVLLFAGFTPDYSGSTVSHLITTNGFYYPAGTIKTIINQGNGLRMYNASFPSNGGETLMAVAVSGEADAKNVPYYVFKGVTIGSANIASVDKNTAIEGCRNLGNGSRFAITLSRNEVNHLLSQPRAGGIAFYYATNGMGYRTLKASPATVEGRNILVVNEGASIVVEHPCPLSCGADSQTSYLCDMQ